MKQIIYILILCLLVSSTQQKNLFENLKDLPNDKDAVLHLLRGIQKIVGVDNNIEQLLDNLHEKIYLQNKNQNETQHYDIKDCLKCKGAVVGIIAQGYRKLLIEKSEDLADWVCGPELHMYPDYVCNGTVQEQTPYVIGSLFDHYINGDILCPALNYCPPVYEKIDIDAVVEDILKDNPQKEQVVPKIENTFKVLHISDIHSTNRYNTRYTKNCPDPVCCIPESGLAEKEEDKPGYWGHVGFCDLPLRTMEKMVQFIRNHVHVDFGLWTGDNTSHQVWEQSFEENIESSRVQTKILRQQLPNVRLFPIMGNHESFPVNIFDFKGNREKEFQEFFGDIWEQWIGKEAAADLRKYSFYETSVPEHPNLKIIALNTQAGDSMNWTLIRNPTDPNHMLQKLRKALQDAENNNQAVYIICHIPSGEYLMNKYAKILAALIERYNYNIRAIFTGHTHKDQIELYYKKSQSDKNPIAVNWITPSVTTYSNLSPSFRVYKIDSETYQVIDYEQYRLNLDYWNQFPNPRTELKWDIAYTFLKEYNLPNAWDLNNLNNLKNQVLTNLDVYNKYTINYHSGNSKPKNEIDRKYGCLIYGVPQLQRECEDMFFIPSITSILAGPWIQRIKKHHKNFLSFDEDEN